MARVTQRAITLAAVVLAGGALASSVTLGFLYVRELDERDVLVQRLDVLGRRTAELERASMRFDEELAKEKNATLECLSNRVDSLEPRTPHINDLLERKYRNPEIYQQSKLPGLLRDPTLAPR